MKKGKLLALVLSIVLVFGSFSAAFANTAQGSQYSDMPDNWSKAALSRAVGSGLLKGYEDGSKTLIKANNPLTRAEMAAVINRAFGATVAGDLKTVTDVPASAWYAKDMAKAVKMNTFAFDTKMRPDDLITRQEAFAVLARAFKLTNTDTKNKALDKFTDKRDIASWALKELNGLAEAGYIKGSPDGKLYPNANITRAEFAVVMDSLIKQYIDQTGIVTDVTGNGNVMIRTGGVILKGVTIKGDLIIGDGVGEGDAVLEDVKVEGRTLVRGGGVNSIIIKGNSDIGKVIVCKTFGEVRVATEGDAQIEVIYIDDGSDDVIVNGTIGALEVVGDNITVTATEATITQGIVKGEQSSIIVRKGSTVNTITVSGPNAIISGEGEVKAVTVTAGGNNAAITTSGTKIDVDKNANGVTGGGGVTIPEGTTETNNQNGTGILSPTTGSGGGGGGSSKVEIIAVGPIEDIVNIAKGTAKEELNLPTQVEVTITGGTKKTVDVVWDEGTLLVTKIKDIITYNPDQAGNYTFVGGLKKLPEGVTNPNKLTASVKVIVLRSLVDTTSPVIKLLGSETVFINVGGTYVDAGATALDDNSGDITDQIIMEIIIDATGGKIETVDTSKGCSYTLKYNVMDDHLPGNKAVEVTRKVIVVEKVSNIIVTTNNSSTSVLNGNTLQMMAQVLTDTATNKDVTWSVESGTGTATISEDGMLTATGVGTVTVKATAKDGSEVGGSVEVSIYAETIPVENVAIDVSETSILVDETVKLISMIYPESATNKVVTWSSSDPAVATVNSNGIVTGVKAGTAIITVTTVDGNKTASCEVEVRDGTPEEKITPVAKDPVAATSIDTGQTLSSSRLDGTFTVSGGDATLVDGKLTWDAPDTVVNETGHFNWTFTPADTATYKVVKGTVSVKVLIRVTATVVTSGSAESFKVNFDPAVKGLTGGNFALSIDAQSIGISVSGGPSEYWVTAVTPLTRKQAYSLSITKEGYNFGGPIGVLIPGAGEVKGRVLDNKNNPLKDVNVSIFGGPVLGKDTMTNDSGEYSIQNVIEGIYSTLSFAKHGHVTKHLIDITVENGKTIEIEDQQLLTENQAKMAKARANLTLGDVTAVIADLTLPSIQDDATITWVSSNTEVITNDGKVTRPAFGKEDVSVTLTATIDLGGARGTKDFTVVVKALGDAEQAVFEAEQAVAEFEDGVYTREEYNTAIGLRNSANTKVSELENGDAKTALQSRIAKVSEDLDKYKVLLDEFDALATLPKYNFNNPLLQNLQQIVKRYTLGSDQKMAVRYTWITTDPDIAYIYESDEPDHINCELVVFRPEHGTGNATTTLNLTMTYLGKILKNNFLITITEFTEKEQGYITTLKEKANTLISTFQMAFPDNIYNESGMDQLVNAVNNYNLAYYAAQNELGFIGNLDKIDETYHSINLLQNAMEYIIGFFEDIAPTELYEDFPLPTTEVVDYPGITVNWISSNPDVMDSEGIVTRPAIGQQDAVVTLTLTLNSTLTGLTLKNTFNFTVLAITPLEEITIGGITAVDMLGVGNNGKVQVSWIPLTQEQITKTGAQGYTVFYQVKESSSGYGWVDIEGAENSLCEISNLSADQEYEIYVLAYNEYFSTKGGEPVTVTTINE